MKTKINPSPARRASQRGNAMIEFAICAVVMVMITVGVTDFSRMFSVAEVTASAAAAGAQYGALSPAHWSDFAGIQEAAQDDAGSFSNATATASNTCYCTVGGIAVTCPADCSGGGSPMMYITVNVSAPYSSAFNYPWMPAVPTISSTNTVRVQ
jgi:Flp pilus assembly protein TadG